MASAARSLYFANQFVISCGTVSVDLAAAKVLLIRCQRTGEDPLPEGRKDIGERLEHTATRETFEEAGVSTQLLPLSIETMAILPSVMKEEDRPKTVTEPIAVTQRFNKGILEIIFWYVAGASSTADRVEGTQDEDEGFKAAWVGFEEVESMLSFDDDRSVAREAINAVNQSCGAI